MRIPYAQPAESPASTDQRKELEGDLPICFRSSAVHAFRKCSLIALAAPQRMSRPQLIHEYTRGSCPGGTAGTRLYAFGWVFL